MKGAVVLLQESRMRCHATRPYRCGCFNIGSLEVSIGRVQVFQRESRMVPHMNAD